MSAERHALVSCVTMQKYVKGAGTGKGTGLPVSSVALVNNIRHLCTDRSQYISATIQYAKHVQIMSTLFILRGTPTVLDSFLCLCSEHTRTIVGLLRLAETD